MINPSTIFKKSQRGFTLLETVIYLALFVIIIGGGMVAAYQVIEATDGAYNHVILQEGANFVFRKINWALTGSTITSISSSVLTVSKNSNSLTFTQNGTNITLEGITLNSSSILVSNLLFTDIPAAGGKPRGITTSFTLTTSQSGRPATQIFYFTKYLRQ